MINKHFLFILALVLVIGNIKAQDDIPDEAPPPKEIDSLAQDLENSGIVIQEVTYEKKPINPLAPSKAAFYSAVLPGLGQFYNKRGAWWKIPVIYGGFATGVGLYAFNNGEYNKARNAFKRRLAGFEDDEFFDINGDNPPGSEPDVDDEALESAQENLQRSRDLWLVLTIVWYSLNIIEANVTAHLMQYNVDDTLSFDMRPFLNLDPVTNNPNYGMALVISF